MILSCDVILKWQLHGLSKGDGGDFTQNKSHVMTGVNGRFEPFYLEKKIDHCLHKILKMKKVVSEKEYLGCFRDGPTLDVRRIG